MLARRGRLSAQRLNEGLPQKGKRSPPAATRSRPSPGLNEGLPQKGKR